MAYHCSLPMYDFCAEIQDWNDILFQAIVKEICIIVERKANGNKGGADAMLASIATVFQCVEIRVVCARACVCPSVCRGV